MNYNKPCAVILGGYVNAYSIVQELSGFDIKDIVLVVYDSNHGRELAEHSRFVKNVYRTGKDARAFAQVLSEINKEYDYLVLFPTDDYFVEMLCAVYDEIKDFCFAPVDPVKSVYFADKSTQYALCEEIGIPYPKTVKIRSMEDFDKLADFMWPVIVKPEQRKDLTGDIFRLKVYESKEELKGDHAYFSERLKKSVSFIASEVIPGNGSNIYAYTAYCNRRGEILNAWRGRKLTQRPDDFGVFSTATNISPEIVTEQGKLLVENMACCGVIEPEFKYDSRDGKYKLMEVNLRSHMWHRTGCISGVHLHYALWQDALGKPVPKEEQIMEKEVHLCFLNHEISNLENYGREYIKRFKHALFGGKRTYLAGVSLKDPAMFFCYVPGSILYTVIKGIKFVVKKLIPKKLLNYIREKNISER